MDKTSDDIYDKLIEKINETETLIKDCGNLPEISGKRKLRRKIEAEFEFLQRLTKNKDKLKVEHIRSSNIYHLSAIVQCCYKMNGVVKVLESFSYIPENFINEEESYLYERSFVVDIVADYGKTWVKVGTRNPQNLYQASIGLGRYGRKSIVQQVQDMIECASQNQHIYEMPKIIVDLSVAGVTKELKKLLEELKVTVIGETINGDENIVNSITEEKAQVENKLSKFSSLDLSGQAKDSISPSNSLLFAQTEEINNYNKTSLPLSSTLNLDVSTLLAYVSNMTNGHCHAKYKEKLLNDLAKMEQACPIKPILNEVFKDRELICCETAYKDFLEILSTVGGKNEKKRAEEFLKNVTVVPDNPSPKACYLKISSQVKERAKIVFGTGDSLKVLTISANLGFIRATQSQGVKFAAFIHESRALTEDKELKQNL